MGLLLLTGGARTVCIEKDLGCTPAVYGDWATFGSDVADANTAILQAAFDAAAEPGTRRYAFTGPANRCYAIGTTSLTMYSSQALIGSGGLASPSNEDTRQGRTALPNERIDGFTLMRVTNSTNPMILLKGYGNIISNVNLRGARWTGFGGGSFYNASGGVSNYPYFAGVGIEIRNVADTVTGHHQISANIMFCSTGVKFHYASVENQADVCTFPHLEMYECPVGVSIDNNQSIQHHFGHFYYQATERSTALGVPPADATVFDLVHGGALSVSNLAIAGTSNSTTGELTVFKCGYMETNNAPITVGHLYCDATCFGATSRKFRLVKLTNNDHKELYLTVNGGGFAYGNANLATQWYNTDGSDIITGYDSAADIKLRIVGLSDVDRVAYA